MAGRVENGLPSRTRCGFHIRGGVLRGGLESLDPFLVVAGAGRVTQRLVRRGLSLAQRLGVRADRRPGGGEGCPHPGDEAAHLLADLLAQPVCGLADERPVTALSQYRGESVVGGPGVVGHDVHVAGDAAQHIRIAGGGITRQRER
ncbi:hypothetical protein O7621_03435 [Solwaraspora sp. WMMD937]|uniref:hypothetical protein n=1 Tax=Solwaraspora sp. WMMD937 TaxID=3016090 RepID=UPI00249BA1FB|nr:hypothetical protein [Solwaraspora sp. WMMD937]WFE22415.1 hypothetical protein O7621_03435 [Solwaraspora sp. WMMD937]